MSYKLTPAEARAEIARRAALPKAASLFSLETYLFDKQLAFVMDQAPFKLGVTTRRAGKSISCVADLTNTAVVNQEVIVLYITRSRKNAKRLVWPEFKKLNSKFNLGGVVNESDLSITYPSGSVLYLLGASDRDSIEDFRGLPLKKVYLDEAQSFPAYIEQLIDDVLGPALMDHNGQLVLIGTPGPIPNGYFFDLTKNKAWSHHSWSFFDNPKLPFLAMGLTHQDMLNRELNRRGVKLDDPSIQREWFGRWVVDTSSLVYHYNAAINHYEVLPATGNWTYILGVDLGFDDADALAVLCYSEFSPKTFVVEQVVAKKQDITALCGHIDKLKAKYDITKIIIDTGGLGKKIAEEMGKRYSIPMIAAEKTRKVEFIELMNDALRTGRLMVKAESVFAHDSSKVEWDHDKSTPDKKVISSRFHSDICEAVLYAWRESYSYAFQAAPPEPEYGSPEWASKEADKMYSGTVERLMAAKEEMDEYNETNDVEIDDSGLHSVDRPKLKYQSRFVVKKPPTS